MELLLDQVGEPERKECVLDCLSFALSTATSPCRVDIVDIIDMVPCVVQRQDQTSKKE